MSRLSKGRELRRCRRFSVDAGPLEVMWLDQTGNMRISRTRALDISEDGIALQLPEPVLPVLVRFRSPRFKLQGTGSVKYCRRDGARYVVGLEFTDGLHWRSPDEEVRQPISVCDPEAVY